MLTGVNEILLGGSHWHRCRHFCCSSASTRTPPPCEIQLFVANGSAIQIDIGLRRSFVWSSPSPMWSRQSSEQTSWSTTICCWISSEVNWSTIKQAWILCGYPTISHKMRWPFGWRGWCTCMFASQYIVDVRRLPDLIENIKFRDTVNVVKSNRSVQNYWKLTTLSIDRHKQ